MVHISSGKNPGEVFVELAADMGDVESARFLEIPIQGPRGADRLVIIDGIAVPDFDTDEDLGAGNTDTVHITFFIDTNYKLSDLASLIDSSAYVSLASVQGDDSTEVRIAVEAAKVVKRTSGVIQLRAFGALGGGDAKSHTSR